MEQFILDAIVDEVYRTETRECLELPSREEAEEAIRVLIRWAGDVFAPQFDPDGLLLVVVSDAVSNGILMHSYMNAETLEKTLRNGRRTADLAHGSVYGIKEDKADYVPTQLNWPLHDPRRYQEIPPI